MAERPEDDLLKRCTRWLCPEHETQLDWVRADQARLLAYLEQERRYEAGERTGAVGEQGSLLP